MDVLSNAASWPILKGRCLNSVAHGELAGETHAVRPTGLSSSSSSQFSKGPHTLLVLLCALSVMEEGERQLCARLREGSLITTLLGYAPS